MSKTRLTCFGVLLSVCVAVATPVMAQDENRPTQFERDVIKVIMNNPEVLILALEKLKLEGEGGSSDEQLAQRTAPLFEPHPATGVAPVVVEFFDYLCGYCAAAALDVQELGQEFAGAVRLIEYPILGDVSEGLASIALGVKHSYGTADYKRFHYSLMSAMGGKRSEFGALAILEELGLNKELVLTAAGSDAVREEIAKNRRIGRELGVDGTPAFVTRTSVHAGVLSKGKIRLLIERDLKNDQ